MHAFRMSCANSYLLRCMRYKKDFLNMKINQLIQSSTIEPPDVLQEQAKKKEWESVTLFVNTFSDLRYFTPLWKVHYRWMENVLWFYLYRYSSLKTWPYISKQKHQTEYHFHFNFSGICLLCHPFHGPWPSGEFVSKCTKVRLNRQDWK